MVVLIVLYEDKEGTDRIKLLPACILYTDNIIESFVLPLIHIFVGLHAK